MFCLVVTLVVVALRPVWSPIGQVFMGGFVSAALAYLVFAADITVAGHLSPVGSLASALLFILELIALSLASSFAFETCDVLCRTRHSRDFPDPDPAYQPKVSLHIAAYNEPPDMLIETIRRQRPSIIRISRSSSSTTTQRTPRSGARWRSTAPVGPR